MDTAFWMPARAELSSMGLASCGFDAQRSPMVSMIIAAGGRHVRRYVGRANLGCLRDRACSLLEVTRVDALLKARDRLPDLIVMDIQLPGMDGLTAAALLTGNAIRPMS